jgi:hypothetical protein
MSLFDRTVHVDTVDWGLLPKHHIDLSNLTSIHGSRHLNMNNESPIYMFGNGFGQYIESKRTYKFGNGLGSSLEGYKKGDGSGNGTIEGYGGVNAGGSAMKFIDQIKPTFIEAYWTTHNILQRKS